MLAMSNSQPAADHTWFTSSCCKGRRQHGLHRPVLVLLSWGVVAALLASPSSMLVADEPSIAERYELSATYSDRMRGKIRHADVKPHWSADGNAFWFRRDLGRGESEYRLADAVHGTCDLAFDHQRLATDLAKQSGKPVDAAKLQLDNLEIQGESTLKFRFAGRPYLLDRTSGELTSREDSAAPSDEATREASSDESRNSEPPQRGRRDRRFGRSGRAPDGSMEATIRDFNVWIHRDGEEEYRQLTTDGTEADSYGGRLLWSPDSKKLVVLRTRQVEERKIPLVASSPRDQLQPRLEMITYVKPGDELRRPVPHLFDVEAGREVPVDSSLFSNPWSLGDLRWADDSSEFSFLYNERGHQALRVIGVNAASGAVRLIVDETSKTFIHYSGKLLSDWSLDGSELIWMSERSGYCHLYLIDVASGSVKNAITSGNWVVRGVEKVDHEKRQILIQLSGIDSDQDPYQVHYARVNFDGTGFTRLTSASGTHEIQFSPDGRFLLDRYSRVDLPPITELRSSSDGKLIVQVEQADISELLKAGWQQPEPMVAKGRDDTTDIYGVIYRPTHFDPSKKYPIVEQIYAGPHGANVPKEFGSVHSGQAIAELGFVVVVIDGMGTNYRGKAFHDVCFQNLKDAGFPDRKRWIEAAAAQHPEMDLSRVGIYGVSAGGQNAMGALLFQNDLYKVAVAGCGCHDNRMDKIWWNEQWMGWPIGKHYEDSSNMVNAHRMQGKLLLVVGEVDRNVDPASTLQTADALIRANKEFELVVVPGAGHGMGGPYGDRKMRDFLVRHLQGIEPPPR